MATRNDDAAGRTFQEISGGPVKRVTRICYSGADGSKLNAEIVEFSEPNEQPKLTTAAEIAQIICAVVGIITLLLYLLLS